MTMNRLHRMFQQIFGSTYYRWMPKVFLLAAVYDVSYWAAGLLLGKGC